MKQIINELKSQPVIAWVTVIGTALAIFLIMVVVMLNQVGTVPMAPESNRDRLLYVTSLRAWSTDTAEQYSVQSGPGMAVIDMIFRNLETTEDMGLFTRYHEEQTVGVPGEGTEIVDTRRTDEGYFRIYDFDFIAGTPYDSADVASHLKKAVITESLARQFFKGADRAVGSDIEIDDVPYRVTGVVADVSPVTDKAYSQVWMPLADERYDEWSNPRFGTGNTGVALLVRKGEPAQSVIDEVHSKLKIYNSAKAAEKVESDFNGGPYTQEGDINQGGSSRPADLGKVHRTRYFVYALLLLIPAINLSSMTRSRLAYRTGEIGVRRAFGATRSSIIFSIISENMIITLAGGIIGLACALIFGGLLFDAIYSAGVFSTYHTTVTAGAGALFDWRTFAYALGFCFILNILSSGMPAWRASRMNPVDAISARTK